MAHCAGRAGATQQGHGHCPTVRTPQGGERERVLMPGYGWPGVRTHASYVAVTGAKRLFTVMGDKSTQKGQLLRLVGAPEQLAM